MWTRVIEWIVGSSIETRSFGDMGDLDVLNLRCRWDNTSHRERKNKPRNLKVNSFLDKEGEDSMLHMPCQASTAIPEYT